MKHLNIMIWHFTSLWYQACIINWNHLLLSKWQNIIFGKWAIDFFKMITNVLKNHSLNFRSDLTNILQEVNQRKETIDQDQIDVDIINSFNQIFNQTQKSLGMVVSWFFNLNVKILSWIYFLWIIYYQLHCTDILKFWNCLISEYNRWQNLHYLHGQRNSLFIYAM